MKAKSPETNRPNLSPEMSAEEWDRVADAYARYVDPLTAPFAAQAIALAPLGGHETVIDVAAGAGALALQAAPKAERVLAVDHSPAFVEILSRRARQAGLRNVTAEVMDGQALKVGGNAFDRAYSVFGLMMFPDRDKGFQEIHRVLRPSGKAVVTSLSHRNPMAPVAKALKETFPDVAPPPLAQGMELADPERLRSEMAAGGFRDVRVETVLRSAELARTDDYWTLITEATPLFAVPEVLRRMDPEGIRRLRSAVTDILEANAEGTGRPRFPVEAHYAVGRKEA